jgi:hypothetical protein
MAGHCGFALNEQLTAAVSIVEMTANGPLLHMMGDRTYLREHLR